VITTEDLINLLKNKIPSFGSLSGYKTVDNIAICNRNNNLTVACTLSNEEFFKFLNVNNIHISEEIKSHFEKIKEIGFDVESLSSNIFRFYVPKTSIRMFSLWEQAKKYPLESIEIEKLIPNLNSALETIKASNRYERWVKKVDIVDTNYPLVVLKDSFGNLSTVDGRHRIQKLLNQNVKTVNAYVIPSLEFTPISLPENKVFYFLQNASLLNNDHVNFQNDLMPSIIQQNLQISDQIKFENLLSLGMYYDSITNKISTWKFYFRQFPEREEKNFVFQHKFANNQNKKVYKGTYTENTSYGTELFEDQLNLVEELKSYNKIYLSSSKRMDDSNQTYLGIRI